MTNQPITPGTQTTLVQEHSRLFIHIPGQATQEVMLDRSAFTIGRDSSNDIPLPQPESRQHGKLERRGNDWYYTDLQSRNGTYIKGQRVQETPLHHGDILHIGDAEGNLIRLTFRVSHATDGGTPAGTTTGTVLLGATELVTKTSFTIGRNPESDMPLTAPNVSWRHARLDSTPQGHSLVDLGSTNGTFVNGQRITGAHALKQGDSIQIGNFRLIFDGTTIQQYDQRGGLRIDVRNMTFQVKSGRKILNDISLSIEPREFVALVGGSGAGKSTLMKAISGFSRATDGEKSPVLVNGEDYYRNFDAYRALLGYVPQDDILHRELPVNTALTYSAQLRLPSDMSPDEITGRIDRSLEDVEMSDHLGTRVDDLSGGQRKRVSIAAELLADPSLFFLDEPTSGLDPGLEKKMMYTLRRLADDGRTVLLVTHATENIKQCDHVVFLSQGHMVYFGPPDQALGFFGVEGGSFSDIYTRLNARTGDAVYEELIETTLAAVYQKWRQQNPQSSEQPSLTELWKIKYLDSAQYQCYVLDRQQHQQAIAAAAQPEQRQQESPHLSPWRQFVILTRRYFDLMLRDRRNLAILLLQAPIIAILLWLLVLPDALIGTSQADTIQRVEAQNMLFVLSVVAIWFGVINSARELTKERDIYRRERLSNLAIFPYIMSKVTVLSVLMLVQNIALLGIVMIPFLGNGVVFPAAAGILMPLWLEVFITIMLTSLAGMAIGLLISASTRNTDQAISLVPLVLIPQILFTGIIFKIAPGTVEEYLSLVTVSRWSLDALGTSAGVALLCDMPNVTYEDAIQTQCAVNEQIAGEPMTWAFDFLRRGIGTPDIFPGAFTTTVDHLLFTWGILALFLIVGLGLTAWNLKKQDRRM